MTGPTRWRWPPYRGIGPPSKHPSRKPPASPQDGPLGGFPMSPPSYIPWKEMPSQGLSEETPWGSQAKLVVRPGADAQRMHPVDIEWRRLTAGEAVGLHFANEFLEEPAVLGV